MKLGELLKEMAPYHSKGDKPPKYWQKTLELSLSYSALKREFTHISDLKLSEAINDIDSLSFYAMNDGKTIYGGYETTIDGEQRLHVMFVLTFKPKSTLLAFPKDIHRTSLLQVNKVNTGKPFRHLGIAMFVYQLMILKGFTMLSDISQLDGGKGLWQKMARLSHLRDYKIRVINDEHGYFKDRNGKVIEYDGHNIHEDDIWTTGLDLSGQHILLIMSEK